MANVVRPPIWHGTPEAWTRLQWALVRACEHRAQLDGMGRYGDRCFACSTCLITMDQVELDRFAFLPPGHIFVDAEHAERN